MSKDEPRVIIESLSPNKTAIILTLQTAVIRELQQEIKNATNDNRNTKSTD